MRDLTDAQSHYEPESFQGKGLPWVHMDWGTKNVTKSIEDQGIAVTVEGASLAVAAGVWPKVNPDPIVHTPWGTTKRPQIYDTSQTVTLGTACDMEATVGCAEPYQIRYTLDGSDPAAAGALLYSKPFPITTNCTIRAVGLDAGGKKIRFAESQSVLVRRPLSPELTAAAKGKDGAGLVPALLEAVQLELTRAPILWNYGDDDDYRQQPTVNTSWMGQPLMWRGYGPYWATAVSPALHLPGLGLKAPAPLNYNLTQLRGLVPGLSAFTAAAAIDAGCDVGSAAPGKAEPGFNRVFNCHDMAEWQHARVKVYVDGQLQAESPTMQSQGLEWVFNVTLPPSAEVLRLVAMPAEQLDPGYGSGLAVQQNAYDWVDLVGGFA